MLNVNNNNNAAQNKTRGPIQILVQILFFLDKTLSKIIVNFTIGLIIEFESISFNIILNTLFYFLFLIRTLSSHVVPINFDDESNALNLMMKSVEDSLRLNQTLNN